MFKNIKLRFYNAMFSAYMKRAILCNKIAREYVEDGIKCSEKAEKYVDKMIRIKPELKEWL